MHAQVQLASPEHRVMKAFRKYELRARILDLGLRLAARSGRFISRLEFPLFIGWGPRGVEMLEKRISSCPVWNRTLPVQPAASFFRLLSDLSNETWIL
jgi:hypothetical protein